MSEFDLVEKSYLDDGAVVPLQFRSDLNFGPYFSFFRRMVDTGNKVPPWWSYARDMYLQDFVYGNPFMDSMVSVVTMKLENLPLKVVAKDAGVDKYNKLAYGFNDLLQGSLYKDQTLEKFIRALLIQDNGAFLFIKGNDPGDRPLTGMPTGLQFLDSCRCTRTGVPEYPVIFHDYDGNYYKIHDSRIIFVSQSPSINAEMLGVGYCFISRALILAQHMWDVYQYEGEVLGSRSAEEIIYGTGIRSKELSAAFEESELQSDNAGLNYYGQRVFLGLRDANSKLGKLNLKNLPENYNKRDDMEITLTLIALASGGSPNWFYDSVRSGSTKASAAESTKMGESKLELWYINMIASELNAKFLPSSLTTLAGNFDEDNSGTRARIKLNLAQTRAQNIKSGVTDVRTERELQLYRGEITQTQFEVLELKSGRISNGLPIHTLYQTDEKILRDMLYFVTNPLDFTTNIKDPDILDKIDKFSENAQSVALNARTSGMQNNGLRAMYALEWIRKEYERALGVTPKFTFNEGTDSISSSTAPEDMLIAQNANDSTNDNEVLNGMNDDAVIDNHTDQKSFTTVKSRNIRSELRASTRRVWNNEYNKGDFINSVINNLNKIDPEKAKKVDVSIFESLYDVAETNSKAYGGKLSELYSELDFILEQYIL